MSTTTRGGNMARLSRIAAALFSDGGRGGTCGFSFEVSWQDIQACHAGTFVTNAYITTDPGMDVMFLVDNLTFDGKRFSSAADNANGDNDTAYYTPDLLQYLTVPLID